MSEIRPPDAVPCQQTSSCLSVRDGILLGFILLTLVAGETRADERSTLADPKADAGANARPLRITQMAPAGLARPALGADIFSVPPDAGTLQFSATDFRPRKHTLFDPEPAASVYVDTPMLHGTTVWQRMSDYRARDRVRLLTLWESSGSTLSLQAGKRGDPSLQWTSTALNRGGATRGLLDKLFSVSIAGAGETLRGMTHSRGASANPALPARANTR